MAKEVPATTKTEKSPAWIWHTGGFISSLRHEQLYIRIHCPDARKAKLLRQDLGHIGREEAFDRFNNLVRKAITWMGKAADNAAASISSGAERVLASAMISKILLPISSASICLHPG